MSKKFGTFKGVFVPSVEALLGTVLFLLLPTISADIGLISMLLVIIIAHTVTFSTALSLADCTTNLNNVGSGGMYAIVKRSLGKAFGGSIGIQLYLAQAASAGFYAIGFSEPLIDILRPYLSFIPIFDSTIAADIIIQKQIIATAIYIIFFAIVMTGADFTLKIQTAILYILGFSVLAIFIAPFCGFTFENHPVFVENLSQINLFGNRNINLALFFIAFTQFFPAVTGISAGVGMSGDLKDPKKSIVKGTFYAISITFLIYLIATIIFSLIDKSVIIPSYQNNLPIANLLTQLFGINNPFPYNIIGILILLGILFATGSSALSVFMTAPRTLQSLANDKILPSKMDIMAKDFSKSGTEPRFAMIFTFFLGLIVIWMGGIGLAAMIVGILFLIVYAWINGASFLERISGNPTFRPTNKNHWSISLFGFLSSIAVIMLFNFWIGIFILGSQYLLFKLILTYKSENKVEGVWWGVLFFLITKGLKKLNKLIQGSKNWRPVLSTIAFSENHNYISKIVLIAKNIASYKGLTNFDIITTQGKLIAKDEIIDSIPFNIIECPNETNAALAIIQASHPGDLTSNTILLEYSDKVNTVKIVNKILELQKNLLLLTNIENIKKFDRIDIWWRGEKNGNLMALLAYIIHISNKTINKSYRIIRKLSASENEKESYDELVDLLKRSRLSGEIVILPFNENPFIDTLRENSTDTDLILLGLPGNYIEKAKRTRIFQLNEFFFTKELKKYKNLPPILFVKSVKKIELVEE